MAEYDPPPYRGVTRRHVLASAAALAVMRDDTVAAAVRAVTRWPTAPADAAQDEALWLDLRAKFDFPSAYVMFNHGGISPSPRAVLEAQARYAAEANLGPSYVVFRLHDKQVEKVRRRLAALFGCDAEELAVTANATAGLHAGIMGCPAGSGDAFLTTRHDYPRTFSAFRQRERRDGVRWSSARAPAAPASATDLVDPLRAAWPDRCALAVVSHVTFLTGNVYPVRQVADLARQRGGRLLVDGAHSFGLLPFTRDDIRCDMFTTCLHKWVNGPLGTGFFYVRRDRIGDTWPLHPADESLDDDIRKFEQVGTRSAAPYLAIMEALDLHEAIGPARKLARINWLRSRLVARLEAGQPSRFMRRRRRGSRRRCWRWRSGNCRRRPSPRGCSRSAASTRPPRRATG